MFFNLSFSTYLHLHFLSLKDTYLCPEKNSIKNKVKARGISLAKGHQIFVRPESTIEPYAKKRDSACFPFLRVKSDVVKWQTVKDP